MMTDGNGMSPAVVGDLSFATLRIQTDGDEKNGYRLRMRGDNGMAIPTLFVVRQAEGYVDPRQQGDVRHNWCRGPFVCRCRAAGSGAHMAQLAARGRSRRRRRRPSGRPPFASLWPKDNTATNADEIRTAAASMMGRKGTERSVPILLAMREKASNDRTKTWIDLALANAYGSRKEWKSVVPIAERLLAAYPESESAFTTNVYALSLSGRTADAETLAKSRLAKKPKDDEALRALSSNAAKARDYASAAKYAEQIVDELSPTQNDYNNAAWFELFVGNVNHAMENARRATAEESQTSPAALHTLATLYAETGKNIEARDALLRTLDKSRRETPDSSDWYVLGRMAENYGVRDAALAAYKRVDKKEGDGASVWELAQKRLKAMGKN